MRISTAVASLYDEHLDCRNRFNNYFSLSLAGNTSQLSLLWTLCEGGGGVGGSLQMALIGEEEKFTSGSKSDTKIKSTVNVLFTQF